MHRQITLTNSDVHSLARKVVEKIYSDRGIPSAKTPIFVYGIPRGGIPAAFAVAAADNLRNITVIDDPVMADYFIDDIIDSGLTKANWQGRFPGKEFLSLVDKDFDKSLTDWIVFPWEGGVQGSIQDTITRMLQFIGEDPNREGLRETPARVTKAWGEWFSGYNQKPEDILKVFEDGAAGYDQMVIVKAPVYSFCEHHIAPIFGTATVSYIPNSRIVGLSKIKRLVDVFARRLQVQERLTTQIADALWTILMPKGVGVLIKARHMCMESRGVNVANGEPTVTCALRGALLNKPEARAEFLKLAD